jgi:quercetin dioxygenase-like cupin family protein
MYVVSGRMKYFHRAAGETEAPTWLTIEAGQLVYSPPMVEHAVEFLEDSVFLNITGKSREQATYEDDLVRVNLHKPFQGV